jgi:hypothetical protein
MPGPINVKSPNNTSKWQMEFNSAFKGLNFDVLCREVYNDNSSNPYTTKYCASYSFDIVSIDHCKLGRFFVVSSGHLQHMVTL